MRPMASNDVKHWSGQEPVSDSYPGALATAPPLAKSARTSAESSVASPGDVRSRPSSTSKFAKRGLQGRALWLHLQPHIIRLGKGNTSLQKRGPGRRA